MNIGYFFPTSQQSRRAVRLGIAVALAAILMSLAACGKSLDFRNAEISNGKVFKAGANQPFSGKLSDVPDSRILLGHPGWGRALNFLGKGALAGSGAGVIGSLCTASVDEGYIDGKVQCKLPRSEAPMYEFRLTKGKLDGDFRLYDGSDAKEVVVEARFVQGQLDGKHRIFDPRSHKLRYEATYEDGAIAGEEAEYDATTAARVTFRTYKKGQLEGEAREFAPDGTTLVFRGAYAGGKRHGLHEKFDAKSGRKLAEDGYANGERHGPSRLWASDGSLIDARHFENGFPVASPVGAAAGAGAAQASGEACVDAWTAAHRKAVGPDAPIRMDQIGEWEKWCKEGKLPS